MLSQEVGQSALDNIIIIVVWAKDFGLLCVCFILYETDTGNRSIFGSHFQG